MNEQILIEAITPSVEEGRYPARAIAGRPCVVEADIFTSGLDRLRAVVRWRRKGGRRWQEVPAAPLGNDRWRAEFPLAEPARYEFAVEAWLDVYGTWLADLRRRVEVNEPVASEVLEGVALLSSLAGGAKGAPGKALRTAIAALNAWQPAAPDSGRSALASAEEEGLLAAVSEVAPRKASTIPDPVLEVIAERPRTLCGAWYELFPRSQGTVPGRHGTFADVERRLPELHALGFDVIYLTPIHPIGTTARKGPDNAPVAGPDDPGSPWAIGSEHGGHMAIEPQLGTLEDFRQLVRAAEALGMEVALDLAVHCSPDHPWVREHPDWFYRRPDGTIKCAENPPYKYQDVYPLNFDIQPWRPIWNAWLEIVLFWLAQGVKIFRVDNPHTKPFAFWNWLIENAQLKHPDAIFLAEAFTRPKVMKALSKVGFSQSYTYFLWRDTKAEFSAYLTELTSPAMASYFRPNFFTSTPDVLPAGLQQGGAPAFRLRLVLAATLSPSYGIYSGYELCENEAVPGTEEYGDSEKFRIKVRDWQAPGNIRDLIGRVNAIRRENPALQELTNLRFLKTDNEQMLCYAKSDAARSNVLLIAVNLDPHNAQSCQVLVPPGVIGDGPVGNYAVRDLLTGASYEWGASNYVRLDPQVQPAHILRVERRAP